MMGERILPVSKYKWRNYYSVIYDSGNFFSQDQTVRGVRFDCVFCLFAYLCLTLVINTNYHNSQNSKGMLDKLQFVF